MSREKYISPVLLNLEVNEARLLGDVLMADTQAGGAQGKSTKADSQIKILYTIYDALNIINFIFILILRE